ncbi:hypothetical protein BaRGS_00006657, partial [Batillaria attramentaria]
MCPASYTYKYRIYNVHERGSSTTDTPPSTLSLDRRNVDSYRSMDTYRSLDRRNLDSYRSFARPRRQNAGHSLFYRSLGLIGLLATLKTCAGKLYIYLYWGSEVTSRPVSSPYSLYFILSLDSVGVLLRAPGYLKLTNWFDGGEVTYFTKDQQSEAGQRGENQYGPCKVFEAVPTAASSPHCLPPYGGCCITTGVHHCLLVPPRAKHEMGPSEAAKTKAGVGSEQLPTGGVRVSSVTSNVFAISRVKVKVVSSLLLQQGFCIIESPCMATRNAMLLRLHGPGPQ